MNRVILSAFLISCLLMGACKKKQPPQNPEVPVNLYKVKAKRVQYFDKYPSTNSAMTKTLFIEFETAVIDSGKKASSPIRLPAFSR